MVLYFFVNNLNSIVVVCGQSLRYFISLLTIFNDIVFVFGQS